MEFERPDTRLRRSAQCAMVAVVLVGASIVWAQPQQSAGPSRIYTCIDASGKKLTSDRTITECAAREQRVLNRDGSTREVIPPGMTADERADADAREREAAAERVARQDAMRRDRNLIARFPNEAAHRKAREVALDDIRKSVRVSEARVQLLSAERKPLLDEAEFYVGKAMPMKLRTLLDANDAALEAQRTLIQNQEVEIGRINALYDVELARLRRLWAGAPAGSLAVATPVVATATTVSAAPVAPAAPAASQTTRR